MRLLLKGRLAFVGITVHHGGSSVDVPDVLLDTGSDATVLPADVLAPLGVLASSGTSVQQVSGIGGTEYVFGHWVDGTTVGGRRTPRIQVQVGALDYGFGISGILGLDFLLSTKAILDLEALTIEFPYGDPQS